jgi:glycosyltransferase involved in cell wall biosynthesis
MIMGYPKITLVTPSYQQAHYLPWTLRSVIDQDYPDLEYLVCDGGSTDGSVEVIRSSERHLAWWCSERDGGQAHAINKGFRRATGDIVGWLNSDDMLLPGCLRSVAHAFMDPSIDAICGWGVMMSAEGRVRRRWVFGQPSADRLRFRSILFQPSVFWRRSVMDRIGLLDESFRFCMDQDFFTRMAEHGIVPRLLPRFLAAYRSHPLTKTSTLADVCADESARISGRRGSDARAVSESVSSRACRLFWHKLMIGLPPYRRGLDIHALFRR